MPSLSFFLPILFQVSQRPSLISPGSPLLFPPSVSSFDKKSEWDFRQLKGQNRKHTIKVHGETESVYLGTKQ